MNVNVCHDNGVARFLFVVVPVVSHLWPAVAVGDALAAKGHEVAWCGPEGDVRPLVGPDALIFATGKRSYRELHQLGTGAVRELWDQYLIPLNRFIAGPVEKAVARYRPDLVVADQYAFAGALAAERHGVRWATFCAGVTELTPSVHDPVLRGWVSSKLAQARQRAGLPADDGVDPRFSPYLIVAATTRALTGAARLPANCVLVGAALGTRRTDPGFSWDWWDPGRRHVLVTAGSMSAHLVRDYLARVMTALEPMADRLQVVLNSADDVLPDPPPHVLVAPRIPMLELMPKLDAVICQGGQNTVNEALIHGVPMVIAPIRLGEPAVAEQVSRAGAGVMVSYAHASPAELAKAVTAVLDEPGYRERARRIAGEMSAAGGARGAAEHLAALATRI
ncbi:MAG TPA: glycosyltransferase [Streptosporangiaceae bacterium]|nr:glycosyltransferase [Streptosporangiaceae bacterium]